MSDESKLSSINQEVSKDPGNIKIPTTPIKSDDDVVGGVQLGAFEHVNLDAEKLDELVKKGVGDALKFTPTPKKNQALQTAISQLRQDVVANAPAYINARGSISKRLESIIQKQDPSLHSPTDKRNAINALIIERTLNARFQEIVESNSSLLNINQDLLRFQTGVASTYMKQSLSLNYHQLYSTKNLITLTKAFAEMVESKLEAIKINTKIPDTSKVSLFRRAKDSLIRESFAAGSRAILKQTGNVITSKVAPAVADYIGSEERPDLDIKGKFKRAASSSASFIRKSSIGRRILDTAQTHGSALASAIGGYTSDQAKQFADKHNINDNLNSIWQRSSEQRKKTADFLRSFSEKYQSKDSDNIIHTKDGTVSTEGSRAPPGMENFTHLQSSLTRKDIKDLVSDRLDKIYNLLDDRLVKTPTIRANSYEAHNRRYKREFGQSSEDGETKAPSGGGGSVSGSGIGKGLASLAALFGKKNKDEDKKGVWDQIVEGAEQGLGFGAAELGIGATLGGAWKAFKNRGKATAAKVGLGLTKDGLKYRAGFSAGKEGLDEAKLVKELLGKDGEKLAKKYGFTSAEEMLASLSGKSGGILEELLGKFGTKAAEATAAAGATTAHATGAAAETAANIGVKSSTKLASKFLAKKIPLIGAGLGLAFAVNRLEENDYLGAAGEAASGILSTIPLIGTAGSIFIDGLLLARDINKANDLLSSPSGIFFKARLKAYGADISDRGNIYALEERSYKILSNESSNIKLPELRSIAKKFGFDINDQRAVEYFNRWLGTRFLNIYRVYLAILKKYKFDPFTREIVSAATMTKMLDEFSKYTAPIIQEFKDYIPSPSGLKNTNKPPSDTVPDSKPSTPEKVTSLQSPVPGVIKASFVGGNFEKQPSLNQPIPSPDYSPQPANTNINSVANRVTPSYYSTPTPLSTQSVIAGAYSSALPTASPTTHVANTERIMFSPRSAPFSGSTRDFYNKAYTTLLEEAKKQGLPNPEAIARLGAAQASEESGYGKSAPNNNYFGIKGKGGAQQTREFVNGQWITTSASFRGYASFEDSAADYIKFLKENPRYKDVLAAKTPEEAISAQGRTGYATNPNYTSSLASIHSRGMASTASVNDNNVNGSQVAALPKGTVGSGQCVDLVKSAAGVGHTSEWKCGEPVIGNPALKPGTAIAVFDKNGRYGNHTDGSSHAAIYLGPSSVYPGGIRVYDQWSGQPAHIRDIRPNGSSPVNSASSYSIIKTTDHPEGAVAKPFVGQANVDNTAQASSTISSTQPKSSQETPDQGDTWDTDSGKSPKAQNVRISTPTIPGTANLPPSLSANNNAQTPGIETPGPMQNVITPIRSASVVSQQSKPETTPPPPSPPQVPITPQIVAHPELVASSQNTVVALQKAIAALNNIHTTLQGLHTTMKDAHGPDGLLADMNESINKATSGQQANIFAPIINPVQEAKKNTDDDGLDVSKKREPRYAV